MPDVWDLANIAVKFALYLGVLGGAGTMIVRVWLGPQIGPIFGRAAVFGVVGLCAAILKFLLTAVPLTGDASGMTDPDMLALMWSTRIGDAFWMRALGMAILLAGAVSRQAWIGIVGGALALWSFAQVGHVTGLDNTWLRLVLFAHLIGIAAWIGVLLPLRRFARAHDPATHSVGHKFGQSAAIFVPLLVLAGVMMSWHIVGSLTALIGTRYGLLLMGKVAIVGLLLGIATINKYVLMPQIDQRQAQGFARLARAISFEWLCIIMILLVTAVLTSVIELPT